ncbi:hypothetical protein CH063_09212 [Colletotrichum higginsianum]|uniref:Uncharacterized protein n=1 Tax=Colletotrichum higginsianum (strain IMI 349063) TaxID=759273 RepID=H1VCQ2_COLHI|nr:hypothetical protein CH063_09212 [Colletotrichum higginsianum]
MAHQENQLGRVGFLCSRAEFTVPYQLLVGLNVIVRQEAKPSLLESVAVA